MREVVFALQDTLKLLIESKKYATLRDILITMQPADVAVLFEEVEEEKLPLLFRLLPKEQAADTFVEMDSDLQEMLIRGFSDHELKEIVDELYVDDAVDIVEEMPANVVKRILKQADPEKRKMINEILNYPEDSAGSIMTTEYVSLRPSMTAEEAIKRIRRTGVDKETIYTCYVTQHDRVLIGYLTLKTLLLADDEAEIRDIMGQDIISVTTTDDQEEVARTLSKYDLSAVPVVDKEQRLVGIVTIDDAIDVIEEEATRDMEMMAASTPSDKSYMKTGVFETWKNRIPWLVILMISATFTSIVLNSFEERLITCSVLIAYIPMLMGTGGNSGSQSSVAVIRAISLGEISFVDTFRVFWKEIRVSVLCGVVLAGANFLKLLLVDRMLLGNTEVTFMIALVISVTMACVVICAKTIGCLMPLLADKLKLDPALMASPFITTIVDVLSLLVYIVWATVFLGI